MAIRFLPAVCQSVTEYVTAGLHFVERLVESEKTRRKKRSVDEHGIYIRCFVTSTKTHERSFPLCYESRELLFLFFYAFCKCST